MVDQGLGAPLSHNPAPLVLIKGRAETDFLVSRQVGLECCCDALGDADGPKLQRLDQRQCNKTPGLLYCLAFQF